MTRQRDLVNASRALYYGLFSSFFVFIDDENRFNNLKEVLDVISAHPLTEDAEVSIENLKKELQNGYDKLFSEYDTLFFDPQSPIRTTASFYDEGYESGRKRVEMIEYVLKTEFRKDENRYTDTEDDIGFILSFMYHLIKEEKNNPQYRELQKIVFKNMLNEFADEFIESVYNYKESNLYKDVVVILQSFIDFERMFFDLQKPQKDKREGALRTTPYINLKKTGKGKETAISNCDLGIEEEEAVEEDM